MIKVQVGEVNLDTTHLSLVAWMIDSQPSFTLELGFSKSGDSNEAALCTLSTRGCPHNVRVEFGEHIIIMFGAHLGITSSQSEGFIKGWWCSLAFDVTARVRQSFSFSMQRHGDRWFTTNYTKGILEPVEF